MKTVFIRLNLLTITLLCNHIIFGMIQNTSPIEQVFSHKDIVYNHIALYLNNDRWSLDSKLALRATCKTIKNMFKEKFNNTFDKIYKEYGDRISRTNAFYHCLHTEKLEEAKWFLIHKACKPLYTMKFFETTPYYMYVNPFQVIQEKNEIISLLNFYENLFNFFIKNKSNNIFEFNIKFFENIRDIQKQYINPKNIHKAIKKWEKADSFETDAFGYTDKGFAELCLVQMIKKQFINHHLIMMACNGNIEGFRKELECAEDVSRANYKKNNNNEFDLEKWPKEFDEEQRIIEDLILDIVLKNMDYKFLAYLSKNPINTKSINIIQKNPGIFYSPLLHDSCEYNGDIEIPLDYYFSKRRISFVEHLITLYKGTSMPMIFEKNKNHPQIKIFYNEIKLKLEEKEMEALQKEYYQLVRDGKLRKSRMCSIQ